MKTSSQGLFPASWSFMLAGAPSDLEIHGATTGLAQCHTAGPRLASTKLHKTETRCPRPGRPTRLRLLLKPGSAGCRGAPLPFGKAGQHVTALPAAGSSLCAPLARSRITPARKDGTGAAQPPPALQRDAWKSSSLPLLYSRSLWLHILTIHNLTGPRGWDAQAGAKSEGSVVMGCG